MFVCCICYVLCLFVFLCLLLLLCLFMLLCLCCCFCYLLSSLSPYHPTTTRRHHHPRHRQCRHISEAVGRGARQGHRQPAPPRPRPLRRVRGGRQTVPRRHRSGHEATRHHLRVRVRWVKR